MLATSQMTNESDWLMDLLSLAHGQTSFVVATRQSLVEPQLAATVPTLRREPFGLPDLHCAFVFEIGGLLESRLLRRFV
jgi:hypothetical protein